MTRLQSPPPVSRRRGRPPAGFSARAQILLGAARAFGEHGYARTSVQHIILEAGVSRRTFYRFFQGKEAVFEEIFAAGVELSLGLIRQAIAAAGTKAAKLEAGIDAYLNIRRRLGPLARVLLTEQFPRGSPFERRREEAMAAFARLIEEEYRGVLRRRVDPLLIGGLVAGMDHVAVLVASSAPARMWDVERAKRVMLRMLAASLADGGDQVPPLPLLEE